MKKSNLPTISKFGLVSIFLFIIFSFIGRVLFPFGDEPDFTVRAPRVIYGEHPWWSPYSIFHDFLLNLNSTSTCKIYSSPTSLWAHIDSLSCSESLEQILIRLFITFILLLPLFFFIVNRKYLLTIFKIFKINLSKDTLYERLDILSILILFPGMIYYLGILADEQFVLVLELYIFLFWNSWILVFLLFFLITTIDIGNSVVLLNFIIFYILFEYIAKKFRTKISFMLMLFFIIFALVIGFTILDYISAIILLADKAQAMSNSTMLELANKYPIFLRPVITFMTGIFMPPSGIKVIPLYLILACLFFTKILQINGLYKKTYRRRKNNNIIFKKVKYKIVIFYTAITTILFFVFLFPSYANAKYYMFTLPFLLYAILEVSNKKNILKLFVFGDIMMFISLYLYQY